MDSFSTLLAQLVQNSKLTIVVCWTRRSELDLSRLLGNNITISQIRRRIRSITIIHLKWISKSKNGCRSSAPLLNGRMRVLGSQVHFNISYSIKHQRLSIDNGQTKMIPMSYYKLKTINLMSIINLLLRPHFSLSFSFPFPCSFHSYSLGGSWKRTHFLPHLIWWFSDLNTSFALVLLLLLSRIKKFPRTAQPNRDKMHFLCKVPSPTPLIGYLLSRRGEIQSKAIVVI